MSKLVLLGVDGFDPELLEFWGKDLPNLMQMQMEGTWGRIKNSVTPTPKTAWKTIMKGSDSSVELEQSKAEPLFKYLYDRGQKVALINLPFTWPAPRVTGGYAVSSLPAGSPPRDYTWPASLSLEITKIVGEYLPELSLAELQNLQPQLAVEQAYKVDAQKFALLQYFIENKQCDFIMFDVQGLDRVSHLFRASIDEDEERKNALHNYYMKIDQKIVEIRSSLSQDTALLVLSPYNTVGPPSSLSSLPEEEDGHGPVGYFCLVGPGIPANVENFEATLLDIFPTVLAILEMKVPETLPGKSLITFKSQEKEEKAAEDSILNRLTMLGY